jgi:WD40 repeat protein
MTSRLSLLQSARVNRTNQVKRIFISAALLVCVFTLLLFIGCSSKKKSDAENKSGKDTTGSNDAGSSNNNKNVPANGQKNQTGESGSSNQKKPITAADTIVDPFITFELLGSLPAGFSSVDAIAFAPDGKTFVTCSDMPKIWQIGSQEPLHEFEDIYPMTGTVLEPEAVAISSDGKLLTFAGGDGVVYVFDFATRQSKHQMDAHSEGVASVSISADGKRIASSGYDGKAKVWNVETGELVATCNVQDQRRVRSAVSPDGTYLVTAGNEAEIWDAATGKKKSKLDIGEPRQVGVWCVDISADGKRIVTGDANKDFENCALVWSADSGKLEATLKHEYGVFHVDISPDGNWLATADVNGVVRIWRLADSEMVQEITLEDSASFETIQWTPDSKMLAISSNGNIHFWGTPALKDIFQGEKSTDEMPDDTDKATPDPVAENETKDSDSPQATPVQPASPKTAAPIAKYNEVQPISVTDAARIFSAKDFPAPFKAAPGMYASSKNAGYQIRKPFDEVIAELDKTFAELNWTVVDRGTPADKNVAYCLQNEQLLISCKAREEQPSVVRVDLNVLGNVDIRSIPKLDPQKVNYDLLDYSVYETNRDLDEIMSHYDRLLTDSAWQSFVDFDSLNETNPDWRRRQYRNAGVNINVSAMTRDGVTYATIFCEMLDNDVPTPPGVSNYEMDDHLFRQRFVSQQSIKELTPFFIDQMKHTGWTLAVGKSLSTACAGMLFTRADEDPVYLELWQKEDGKTEAYMAGPTRQVTRAAKGEFEVEYEKGKPLTETQMHSVDYRTIPFNNALPDGSGRTIAESVFFNTNDSMDEIFKFYEDYFSKLGWQAGKRDDKYIGETLNSSSLKFTKGDASIEISLRPWVENSNRCTIEGNGIFFPGARFCHMLARADEATNIE